MSAKDLGIGGIAVKALRSKDLSSFGGPWQQSWGSAAKSLKNKDFLLRRENRRGTLFR
jgi:hypothetical protein